MKLKYIIPSLIAVLAMCVSCSDDEATYLDEVKVSSSYVAIPAEGGSVTIDVNAVDSWEITDIPEWVTVSPSTGSAGTTQVTFTAEETTSSKEATVYLTCAGKTQDINILQMTEKVELPISTCSEIINGPDSKTYRAKGTVTSIANTTYGNWYLQDETGSIYIYGTLDAQGNTKNFLSWGLEVGDIITVEGPKTVYNGTVELVDVTVIEIEKSLIKVDSLSVASLPKEGGEVIAYLTNKGDGVSVDIPESVQDWLSIKSIVTSGDVTLVTFRVAANEGGARSADLTLTTTSGGKEYAATTTIAQEGSIVDVTVADFNAAEVGSTQYRITGVVSNINNASKGRFYIKDWSGETYVYNMSGFESLGVKEGDIITLVGTRAQYNTTIEMTNAVMEKLIPVTEISIEDFLVMDDANDVYYMVTGTISSIANSTYGNLYITDGDNELYVYGCYPGYGAIGDNRKNFLDAADIEEGDTLTMIGYKTTYNGTIELAGGIYFSHKKQGE